MTEKMRPGTIGWADLTVDDAGSVRAFYESVVGWKSTEVNMGEYSDFAMIPAGSETAVAGVCHARGGNAEIPPFWMMYVIVENLDRSMEAVRRGGGSIVSGPKSMGEARYCIIRDPAGAYLALYQS